MSRGAASRSRCATTAAICSRWSASRERPYQRADL
jgi:hypothetical protein